MMDRRTEPDSARSERLAALPEMCATVLPATFEPIVIKRGEAGHWPLPDGMTIERINTVFKATPAHVAAMLVGSMFGWDLPGADPARYDAHGRPLRS